MKKNNSFSELRTKTRALIALAVVIVGILTYYFVLNGHSKKTAYAALSQYSITDVSKLKGNYFILHFWAKWCEPCAEEIPQLVEFARKAQLQKPLLVVAVSLDNTLEEAKEILPAHGENLPANFILALDATHKYAEAVGSYQYPESYLISPDGEILEKWVGAQKWDKPEVLEYFKKRIQ